MQGSSSYPSEENIKDALGRVRELRRRAENELQSKVLDSMEVTLLFPEPQPILDEIVGTIFGHLTKEGLNEKHIAALISNAVQGAGRDAEEVQGRCGCPSGREGADALQARRRPRDTRARSRARRRAWS